MLSFKQCSQTGCSQSRHRGHGCLKNGWNHKGRRVSMLSNNMEKSVERRVCNELRFTGTELRNPAQQWQRVFRKLLFHVIHLLLAGPKHGLVCLSLIHQEQQNHRQFREVIQRIFPIPRARIKHAHTKPTQIHPCNAKEPVTLQQNWKKDWAERTMLILWAVSETTSKISCVHE